MNLDCSSLAAGISCGQIVPWVTTAAAVAYGVYVTLELRKERAASGSVNRQIKKDSNKVVDTVDLEEIGQKGVFCRCWKSKKVTIDEDAFLTYLLTMFCYSSVVPLLWRISQQA